MDLSMIVNQRLLLLRIIERALNETSHWSIRVGDIEAPASVEMGDTGVLFRAVIPRAISGQALLCLDGEVMFFSAVPTLEAGDILTWSFNLDSDGVPTG
jgi:hypothetical protein